MQTPSLGLVSLVWCISVVREGSAVSKIGGRHVRHGTAATVCNSRSHVLWKGTGKKYISLQY
jgi:hypothetical protein